jgi:hypothetical protein
VDYLDFCWFRRKSNDIIASENFKQKFL